MDTRSEFESLKTVIHELVALTDAAWEDFTSGLRKRTVERGAYIWRAGQVCKHLVFQKSGLARSFSCPNGNEITHRFYDVNSLYYDDYSFISQNPSKKSYQLLEDSELLLIERAHLNALFDKYKCFERLGRIAVEQAHVQLIDGAEMLNQQSAEENYRQLLATNPSLLQRVSLKTIASFLQVSPEHLSRIRSKLSKDHT